MPPSLDAIFHLLWAACSPEGLSRGRACLFEGSQGSHTDLNPGVSGRPRTGEAPARALTHAPTQEVSHRSTRPWGPPSRGFQLPTQGGWVGAWDHVTVPAP